MGCRRHGKAVRVFVGMLFKLPCRIMAGNSGAMRLSPVRWALLISFMNRHVPAAVFIYHKNDYFSVISIHNLYFQIRNKINRLKS